jgi:MFS-type transporter involved in bile tolerance (Atg22 family)
VHGSEALGLSTLQIGTVLMVQFVAFFGAILFGYIAKSIGDKLATLITLAVWVVSVSIVYLYLSSLFFYLKPGENGEGRRGNISILFYFSRGLLWKAFWFSLQWPSC